MDLLFGHDHDDLNSIISEVCEKFVEQSRILEQVQNNALLALQLYPEGFDDLREALGMQLKNKKAQKSMEAAYKRRFVALLVAVNGNLKANAR